jgi:hypothetical protein
VSERQGTADFGKKLVDNIVKRQAVRRASVEAAHRGHTVWCCATDAEECFNDLETLLRCLGLQEQKL